MCGSTLRCMTWLYLPALFVAFAFVALLFVTGGLALRAPEWDVAFHELAFSEARRRGFARRQFSLRDRNAIARMAGAEPTPSEAGELTLAALTVFSGSTDAAAFTTEIEQRRLELLDRMCERQLARVNKISSVEWASRVWVVQRFLSRVEVAARGIVWLVPKTVTVLFTVTAKPFGYATLLGFFCGMAYGWITRGNGADPGAVVDTFVRVGGISVAMWSIGVLIFRMLVLLFGPADQWPRRSVVTAFALVGLSFGVGGLAQFVSDKLHDSSLLKLDSHDPTTIRITAALMAIGMLWFCGRALRNFRDRQLLMSDRVGSLGVIAMLVSLSILSFGMAITGAMPNFVRTAGLAMYGLSMCLMLVSGVFWAIEWVGRRRWLKRHGIAIRGRRLLRWLLTIAAVSWAGMIVLSSIHSLVSTIGGQLAMLVFAVGAFFTMWPSMLLTWLYIRRVNRLHERHHIVDTPPDQDGDDGGDPQVAAA